MQCSRAIRGRRSKEELASSVSWRLAPECLVFVDVADDNAERIGEEHGVGDFAAEAIDDVGGPTLAALLLLIARRVEDLLKLDVSAIRGLPGIVENDGFDLDVYVGCAGIEQKRLESLRFVHAGECGRLHLI